jgi:protein-tyrosine phosphatase
MFKNILFVCTGNICRSPMAEYLFRDKMIKLQPDSSKNITLSSAGTHAVPQGQISLHAKQLLNEENISCNQHEGAQITKKIIHNNDLILVMENIHKYSIKQISPESLGKVFLLGHWGKHEIADPYQQDLPYFREIKQQINQGIECWLKKIFS